MQGSVNKSEAARDAVGRSDGQVEGRHTLHCETHLKIDNLQTGAQFSKVSKFTEVGVPCLCASSVQNQVMITSDMLVFDYKPQCEPLNMEGK